MTKLCNTCEYLRFCARSGIEDVGCYRYKKDMTTNEEYLRSCNTEELAELITDIVYECKDQDDCMDCRLGWCSKDYVVKWLKEIYHG